MAKVSAEVAHNYGVFAVSFPERITANAVASRGKGHLVESYGRIATLNSLKIDLIIPNFSVGAAQFFFEAHNDALLSHVHASFGSWRAALQSLRSFMENIMSAIYYADHPIELEKWETGDFRLSPRELREYCASHPRIAAVNKSLNVKDALDAEYATLSKAVHASNTLFRMTTAAGDINIGSFSDAELGKWSTREKATISICTLIVVAVLHTQLDGAKRPQLRKALGLTLSAQARKAAKEALGVIIAAPT